jgi:hypothetical protein
LVIVGGMTSLVLAALLLIVVLNVRTVSAQDTCTLETISGTYIFHAQGSVVDEEGGISTYVEAGTWTLDGAGNAVGVLSASMNGEPFARREAFDATYAHDSGCVFSAQDAFGLEFDLYPSADGSSIMYFSPGFSGTMIRQ